MEAGLAMRQAGADRAEAHAVALTGIDITFGLKDGGRYQAVKDVTVNVRPGEFVAVCGPTGCGKSTLLNAAAGLLQPSGGQVRIFGDPLQGLNLRSGYLFQLDALMPWKTALQNVAVALESKGIVGRQADERAREWLARVGLRAFTDRYPHMLSGGQKKRVALAQVLIRDPEILLMDEPFGALDPITRIRLQDELLLIQKKLHKTIVIVTHDIDEAIRLADIVAVMQSGKLVQLAPPARLLAEPASPFVEALLGHDRLLKLMRTTPITAVSLDPPTAVGGPRVESRLPVEEALLAMVAAGSDRITVVEEGAIIGSLNASQLLRSVVPAARQRIS